MRCAVLRYAVLSYDMLCYGVLQCTTILYATLCYAFANSVSFMTLGSIIVCIALVGGIGRGLGGTICGAKSGYGEFCGYVLVLYAMVFYLAL